MGRRLTARGSTRSGRWGLTTRGGKDSPGRAGAEPPHSIDEADPLEGHTLALRRFEHDDTDEVVDQGKHSELFHDAGQALTVQHVEPHGLPEVTQIGLRLPSAPVQVGQGVGGIPLGLQEGGDQRHPLRPKARLGHPVAEFAHAERPRQRGKPLGR